MSRGLKFFSFGLFAGLSLIPWTGFAEGLPSVSVSLGGASEPEQISTTLQILLMVTILTIAPAILITMTSFTRFVIVFSLLRQAMGVTNVPPNQILIGLALFMSMAVMAPTIKEINENALQPYIKNQLRQEDALEAAMKPLRSFMFKHTREKDLALFIGISGDERPSSLEDISTANLIPSFIISELKTAFQIGFMIYIPFLVIDIVVASILLAMGMLVLPPVIISLPFKLMLFVLVDGWNLITSSLVRSFGVII
ncbi:MAG: flagellar biosynthetic protein FliP [Bradymonadales bacterium]|nr:MAG: flagellar biosynthetic protein FliP [Bradymonadales bacterium]